MRSAEGAGVGRARRNRENWLALENALSLSLTFSRLVPVSVHVPRHPPSSPSRGLATGHGSKTQEATGWPKEGGGSEKQDEKRRNQKEVTVEWKALSIPLSER